MKHAISANAGSTATAPVFDLFRIEKAKAAVDLSPHILRRHIKDGLNCYRRGKPVFVSRAELGAFLASRQLPVPDSCAVPGAYDLFKVSRSKEEVDMSPNYLRALRDHSKGALALFKRGKGLFCSRSELAAFMRSEVSAKTIARMDEERRKAAAKRAVAA